MSPADAAKLLDLPADATMAQLEARFLDLRAKLEDRIAKAPTPGLKAKYRESLDAITLAFETLTLAADSSNLPVIQLQGAGSKEQGASASSVVGSPLVGGPGSEPSGLRSQVSGFSAAKRKRSSSEFLIVALIAVALLGAGGWFVMKTRAENEEKARLAAEARAEADRVAAATKAEAERRAEEARLAAEAKRKADDEEKARLAAAEKAEQARQNALIVQLRTELAEIRIAWESLVKEERNAERALNDYRSEARSLQRDGPAAKYHEFVARAAVTQRYLAWLGPHLEGHPVQIARAKIDELLSAHLPDQAQAMMEGLRSGLATLQQEVAAQRTMLDQLEGFLQVNSTPAGLDFELVDGFGRSFSGRAPLHLKTNPGPAVITARRPGYQPVSVTVPIEPGATAEALLEIVSETVTITTEPDVEIWSQQRLLGRGRFTMANHPPNKYDIELRRASYRSFFTQIEIKQGNSSYFKPYNFTAMSAQKHICDKCQGARRVAVDVSCSKCFGSGQRREGNRNVRCYMCDGSGQKREFPDCYRCGGDGRLSDIDLTTLR